MPAARPQDVMNLCAHMAVISREIPGSGAAPAKNRSVERACSLLMSFSRTTPALTLADLSLRVGLPKPTTYRLAATLVQAGFMSQGDDGRYGLGFRLMELGAIVRENLDVVQICAPAMEHLAAQTGETVILGAADWAGLAVTIVHRVDSAHTLSVLSPVGRRSPIPPGAIGKALLMGLPGDQVKHVAGALVSSRQTAKTKTDRAALARDIEAARAVGYAVEEGEYLEDVSGVAAPVIFENERPLAAIAVVGPTTRLRDQIDRIGALVRGAAAAVNSAPPDPPSTPKHNDTRRERHG
jgi:IclR family transcriptional regulator, acetate operon repressor